MVIHGGGNCFQRTKDSPHEAHNASRLRSRSARPTYNTRYKRKRTNSPIVASLPLGAQRISKHDFYVFEALFAHYLELQKQLTMSTMSDTEVRGRWKSFVGKWNRGELAEGWYDPETLVKTTTTNSQTPISIQRPKDRSVECSEVSANTVLDVASSDEGSIGPIMPNDRGSERSKDHRAGPAIPSLQDLELRQETVEESFALEREKVHHQRIRNRRVDMERLEEIAPRAEAGTKERMLERKKEKAAINRAFAASKTDTAGIVEVPESDLLGDDEGLNGFKKRKHELARKKNEREIRREEVLRARAADREERVKRYRVKEEATMKGLVELAKARFG